MKNEGKAKNTPPDKPLAPLPLLIFLLLWTLINGSGWVLMTLLSYRGLAASMPVNVLMLTLIPGVVAAAGQTQLMKYGLDKNHVRGWFPVSLAGSLASAAAVYALAMNGGYHISFQLLLALTVPAALVQALWLQRRVKQAWLWVVAGAISGMLFILPLIHPPQSPRESLMALSVGAGLQGIVTGLAMRYLWTQEITAEKKKKHMAESSGENDERLNRLHDPVLDAAVPESQVKSRKKAARP